MTQTASRLSEQRAYIQKLRDTLEVPPLDDRANFEDCTGAEQKAVAVIEHAIRGNAGRSAVDSMVTQYAKKQLKRIIGEEKTPAKIEVIPDDLGRAYKPLPQGVIPNNLPAWHLPVRDAYIQHSMVMSPEGYEDFHEAAFWFLASTVAAHRIYAATSHDLYTPLYFAYAARSGLHAKSETIGLTKKVLQKTGLDFLLTPDQTTPQKLLSDMGGKFIDTSKYGELTPDQQELMVAKIAFSGQRGFIMNELAPFVRGMINQNSVQKDFHTIFLQFYDSPMPSWSNATIVRGVESIEAPYLAIIGALTPSAFTDGSKSSEALWKDGTWARFNFVCPPKGSEKDELFDLNRHPIPSSILTPIVNWHQRLGSPFIVMRPVPGKDGTTENWEPEFVSPLPQTGIPLAGGNEGQARQVWKDYRTALKEINKSDNSETFDSAYVRMYNNTVIRVATLAASLDNSAEIEVRHMVLAINFCEKSRVSLHRLHTRINAGETEGQPTLDDKIISVARRLRDEQGKGSLTQRDFAQYMNMNIVEILPYLQSLAKNGVFKQSPGRKAGTFKFELVEEDDNEDA